MASGEFGPQSAAADRFLESLDRLDIPETVALAAAGGGLVGADPLDPQVQAREGLRGELREIAVRAGRLDAVRAIGREVERWAGSTQTWFPAGVAATGDSTATLGPRFAALPFVLDAAYAVVLADELRGAELDLLLGPWRDLAGDPFQPGAARGGVAPDVGGDPDWAGAAGQPDDRWDAEALGDGEDGSDAEPADDPAGADGDATRPGSAGERG